jgi:hypothetical protein
MRKMLSLFYFGPHVVTEVEKKIDGVTVRDNYGKVIIQKINKEAEPTGVNLNPYTFMHSLLKLARESEILKIPHDVNVLLNCYLENRTQFKWPRDDREASAVLHDFFSE